MCVDDLLFTYLQFVKYLMMCSEMVLHRVMVEDCDVSVHVDSDHMNI